VFVYYFGAFVDCDYSCTLLNGLYTAVLADNATLIYMTYYNISH